MNQLNFDKKENENKIYLRNNILFANHPMAAQSNEQPETLFKGKRIKYLCEIISLMHCPENEMTALFKIFEQYDSVFQLPGDTFRHTDIDEHRIALKPNISPINQRQFRIPEHYKGEINRQIRDMEKNGIMSRCDYP